MRIIKSKRLGGFFFSLLVHYLAIVFSMQQISMELDYCFSMPIIFAQRMWNSWKLISIDLSICNWPTSLYPSCFTSSLFVLLSAILSVFFRLVHFSYLKLLPTDNISFNVERFFIRLVNFHWIFSMINCGKPHRYRTDNSVSYWLQCVHIVFVCVRELYETCSWR